MEDHDKRVMELAFMLAHKDSSDITDDELLDMIDHSNELINFSNRLAKALVNDRPIQLFRYRKIKMKLESSSTSELEFLLGHLLDGDGARAKAAKEILEERGKKKK